MNLGRLVKYLPAVRSLGSDGYDYLRVGRGDYGSPYFYIFRPRVVRSGRVWKWGGNFWERRVEFVLEGTRYRKPVPAFAIGVSTYPAYFEDVERCVRREYESAVRRALRELEDECPGLESLRLLHDSRGNYDVGVVYGGERRVDLIKLPGCTDDVRTVDLRSQGLPRVLEKYSPFVLRLVVPDDMRRKWDLSARLAVKKFMGSRRTHS